MEVRPHDEVRPHEVRPHEVRPHEVRPHLSAFYFFKPPFHSDGGCAAASGGRSWPVDVSCFGHAELR